MSEAAGPADLSAEETQILGYLREGLSWQAIAERLDISEGEAASRADAVLGRLGMKAPASQPASGTSRNILLSKNVAPLAIGLTMLVILVVFYILYSTSG
jgi:hypothetical protein